MTTYRAAYIPSDHTSNGAGFRLTLPEHAALSDADLLAAALPTLTEYNEAQDAIDKEPATEGDVCIGDWTE